MNTAAATSTDTVNDAVIALSATNVLCGLMFDKQHQHSKCNDADVSNQCFQ
jgi:hypothetical protein